MSVRVAALIALGVITAWIVAVAWRRRSRIGERAHATAVDVALTSFVERSLEVGSLGEVLAAAADTATSALAATRVILFEPGTREGQWEASLPGADPEVIGDAERGLFAWFKHNPAVILSDQLGDPRYGAMRLPLDGLMRRLAIDVLVPLVDRGQTLGAIGLHVGRRPGRAQRELLGVFRQEVAAAAANVRLHREAARKLTLEKEVDLASAVAIALVPPIADGRAGHLAWSGHYRPAGQVGSDFWSAYDLGHDRLLVVIGDVVGPGLAGSMASAIAKSCCDALVTAGAGAAADPAGLLGALNHALFRPQRPTHMTCFAALFDATARTVTWANAGHELPYHAARAGLGVLEGAGPMLGDGPDAHYQAHTRPIGAGDSFVLFTDGLSEAMNAEREEFGQRRLQHALAEIDGRPPREALRAVLTAVEQFRAGAQPHDDEALLVVKAD